MSGWAIRLLGEPAIFDATGHEQPVRGHQAWALLARVLLTPRPIERRSLAMELFPDVADPLGALRWCLASLRKALGCPTCLTGDPVVFGFPDAIAVDVWRLADADFDVAAAGPLLDGAEPRCSPEFATWLMVERERIAGIVESRLRQETIQALSMNALGRAVRLAELGARLSPFDERCHILLVKSLALAGRHDAALEHIERTERLFAAELGERPSSALRAAARRTVGLPAGVAPGASVAGLIEAGLAAVSAGAADAGIDCLRRAVAEAQTIRDGPLLARATLELGTALVHAVRGYDDEGAVHLHHSIALAQAAGDGRTATAALCELGYVEAMAGRRPAAAGYLADALAAAEDGSDLARIHGVIAFNLVDWGRVDEAFAHYGLSLDHARAVGNRRREIWSLGLGGWGHVVAGRFDEAATWLGECLDLVEKQNWIAFRPWPEAVLVEARLHQQHRPADLRPALEVAFALSCQIADPCWEGAVARALALTCAAEDDFGRALEWLGEARRRVVRDIDGYVALQVEIRATEAQIHRRAGHGDIADALGREWLALAARTHMDRHVALAAAFIAAS